MLRNVCGERIGKSLLRRRDAVRSSSLLAGSNIQTFKSLKAVKRIFARLQRAKNVEQKVKVVVVPSTSRALPPSTIRKKSIAIPEQNDTMRLRLPSFSTHGLFRKNESLKKVLRNHQKNVSEEDASDASLGINILNGEAMATWSAISSLFSFLFCVFGNGLDSAKNRIQETENQWRILSLNGVQNV